MKSAAPSSSQGHILLGALIVAVALYRVVSASIFPDLPNFSPVMAIALCGGLFLPGAVAWILPAAVLVLSDVALSVVLGYPVLSAGQVAAWACVAVAIISGRLLASRGGFQWLSFAGVLVGNALFFYLVTNTVSWAVEPAYAKSFAGWFQSVTVGLPGLPPTWTFFRNALAGDVLFSALILGVKLMAEGTLTVRASSPALQRVAQG
jgi:hypothetical protein